MIKPAAIELRQRVFRNGTKVRGDHEIWIGGKRIGLASIEYHNVHGSHCVIYDAAYRAMKESKPGNARPVTIRVNLKDVPTVVARLFNEGKMK